MQDIDFYKLDRTAQERFVGSVNGQGLPAPILRTESKPPLPAILTATSGACFLVLLLLLTVGYGNLESRVAIEGVVFLLADILLAALGTFCLLRASAIRREHRASPWKRGLYVFPTGLIDARSPTLRLYPLDDLGGVFGPDVRGLTLDFGGKPFSFPVTDPALVETAKAEIASAKGAVGEATSARESVRPRALAALDPLQGYANPLVSSERMTRERPSWATFAWAVAAGAGVVLGGSLWLLRNARSDEALYAHAAAADTTAAYQAYLERGSRHAPEVSSLLLPRALLQDAQKAGSVEAIEQFMKDHPTGPVVPLAKAALKAALLAELDVAAKAGTLAALADFAQRHDHALVDAELKAARHAVYQAALDHYLAVAADKASPAAALVQRLIAWSEQKGPRVDVRFHSQRSKSLEKADRAAGQSRQFKGVVSLPSHYFDDAAEKPERDAFFAAISQHWKDVFPPEVLSLTLGEPITDPDAALPQVTVPTLFIELGVIWAGSLQASTKPRGVFAGLDLTFDATFRTVDAQKPVKIRGDSWRVPDMAAAKDDDKPEEAIYAAMRAKAIEAFDKKLSGHFFGAAK